MRFFVTCAKGTEGPLRRELADLRIRGPRGAAGGVSFEGTLAEGLKACLWSRVAMRVLLQVGEFPASNAAELYDGVRAVDWPAHLDTRSTLAVSATVRDNPALAHTGFAALKTKDAVVDSPARPAGRPPRRESRGPRRAAGLHVDGPEARLYLDLSGQPLHRRGYRVAMTEAPLKENLAAAVLALGGADPAAAVPGPDGRLGHPGHRAGTAGPRHRPRAAPSLRLRALAVPGPRRRLAAPAGRGRGPGAGRGPRPHRGPGRLCRRPGRRPAQRRGGRRRRRTSPSRWATCATCAPRSPAGTLVTNPPYGNRMSAEAPLPPRAPARRAGPPGRFTPTGGADQADPLEGLYESLAGALQRFGGWRLVLLSGNPLLSRVFLRRADINHRLWNGPLETRLMVYAPRAQGAAGG